MFFKSIRWRLQVWYGLILLIVLAGFGVAAYQLQSGRQWRRIDGDLQRRLNVLAATLRGPELRDRMGGERGPGRPPFNPGEEPRGPRRFEGEPPMEGPREPMFRPGGGFRLGLQQSLLFDQDDTNGFYFVIWARDGSTLTRSTNAPAMVPFPAREGVRGPQPARLRDSWREAVLITPPGEVILVGRSILPEQRDLRRAALVLTGVGGVILALGVAGGWWIASRAIRPIQSISETAVRISAGDLSQRINAGDAESELGQLAAVLNSTFSRLEKAFTQQQQFTSDAAHELRTPLSVILTQTQSALNRERTAGEYRQTVEACQRSAQRMRRLIESLLELARLDAGQENMRRARFDLARLAADCVEQIRPLAVERGIALDVSLEAAECEGDSERIGQVLTNLLSNAVHYNHDNGSIRISTRTEGAFVIIEVRNDGPGIAPEHLPHIFDRFYRADTARTTSKGRTGLGLAISKAIVDAHGGSIEAVSASGQGTVFTVRLPV